jgi:Cu/Ag efflux protein CusF
MIEMPKQILLATLALFLAACSTQVQPQRYPMQGEIKSLDPAAKTATITAGKVGDWMEAMTMEYPIKPDTDFAKLHVGDKIQATVVVNDLKYYVTAVNVVPKQ